MWNVKVNLILAMVFLGCECWYSYNREWQWSPFKNRVTAFDISRPYETTHHPYDITNHCFCEQEEFTKLEAKMDDALYVYYMCGNSMPPCQKDQTALVLVHPEGPARLDQNISCTCKEPARLELNKNIEVDGVEKLIYICSKGLAFEIHRNEDESNVEQTTNCRCPTDRVELSRVVKDQNNQTHLYSICEEDMPLCDYEVSLLSQSHRCYDEDHPSSNTSNSSNSSNSSTANRFVYYHRCKCPPGTECLVDSTKLGTCHS